MKPKPESMAFELACERYAECGVDVAAAMRRLDGIAISVHCWQGDDVGGFEGAGRTLDGGLAVTGNYPGKARTVDELRQDLQFVFSLVPGRHRLNLHAMYGEFAGLPVDRNQIGPEHFAGWMDWAREQSLGLDFNPTFFAHPNAADGFTLSHADPGIREFWIEHGIRCRHIGDEMGRKAESRVLAGRAASPVRKC